MLWGKMSVSKLVLLGDFHALRIGENKQLKTIHFLLWWFSYSYVTPKIIQHRLLLKLKLFLLIPLSFKMIFLVMDLFTVLLVCPLLWVPRASCTLPPSAFFGSLLDILLTWPSSWDCSFLGQGSFMLKTPCGRDQLDVHWPRFHFLDTWDTIFLPSLYG